MSNLEKPLFIKAILQGYIYFRDSENKVHKGFIVGYEENIAYFTRQLKAAYGVIYFFNHLRDGKDYLRLEDCDEELIKNPKLHEAYKHCFNYGLLLKEYHLDFEHYSEVWALNRSDLLWFVN